MQYTQQQMIFPLLDALENQGGKTQTRDLYEAVAVKCGVSEDEQSTTVRIGRQNVNVFQRSVRWAQQQARLLGLVNSAGSGEWVLTGKGKDMLRQSAPGIVITIFTTDMGVALWGRAEEAIAHLDDGSCQLFLSSPPYPLLREKQYGNKHASRVH